MHSIPPGSRLAILFADFHCGGVERMRTLMSAEFQKRGIEVDLVVLNARGDLLDSVPTGVGVVSLDAPRIRYAFAPLVRYLRRSRPDALLADMWPLTSVAVAAAKVAGYRGRVVVVDHNTLSLTPLFQRPAVRMAMQTTIPLSYPRSSARIAVSHGVAEDLARLGHLPASSIQVIYNAAATGNVPASVASPSPWGGRPSGPRVLTVGNLKDQKDHATLLRAFEEIRRDGPAQLAILGDGPLKLATAKLVRELGLEHDVIMPGFVDNVGEWYSTADLFVLSSKFEGFGNVIVEALEHGVPVVSTDCQSGPREILEDGRYGTLVPVGDAPALARAMREALRVPPDRQQLQARARDFLVSVITDRYLDVLFPA